MIHLVAEQSELPTKRILGRIAGRDSSRGAVVFFAGLHGNEPAGIRALHRLLDGLGTVQDKLAGEVICLAGNLPALAANKRFLRYDLNRLWTDRTVLQARNHAIQLDPANPELNEQRELLKIIDPLLNSPPGPLYFVDMHTTSAPSVPFIAINDQLDNRRFALKFQVPGVLGLEEYLEGPMLSYLNGTGHVALAFEAGQHDDANSVDIHESFAWMTLAHAGLLTADDVPGYEFHARRLGESARDIGGMFEVIHRHNVEAHDAFAMKPGYVNFAQVERNEAVANDKDGAIKAKKRCRIFMPLYQSAGSDGFFLVRKIPQWALSLSAVLRKINFENFLVWLPGVSRSPDRPDTLVVNRRVARFLANELFHLLGYRRKKVEGEVMLFSRREIADADRSV